MAIGHWLRPYLILYVTGNTLARASTETVVGKNGKNTDFQPINHYISKTIEDRHIVTMED